MPVNLYQLFGIICHCTHEPLSSRETQTRTHGGTTIRGRCGRQPATSAPNRIGPHRASDSQARPGFSQDDGGMITVVTRTAIGLSRGEAACGACAIRAPGVVEAGRDAHRQRPSYGGEVGPKEHQFCCPLCPRLVIMSRDRLPHLFRNYAPCPPPGRASAELAGPPDLTWHASAGRLHVVHEDATKDRGTLARHGAAPAPAAPAGQHAGFPGACDLS